MKKETIMNFVSKLLEIASNQFCNHGCNDLSNDFWEGVSKEEKKLLYKGYHTWNGDLEDYNPEQTDYLGDAALMAYFSEIIWEIKDLE